MPAVKLKIFLSLFPLLLVGIFFVTKFVIAQSYNVTARVQISVCGNGITEGGEECDGADLNNLTCSNFGFNSGSLTCDIACDFDASDCSNVPGGGGGGGGGDGGGGTPQPTPTSVTFSGRAYPESTVTILKDGQIAVTTIAGPDANFYVTLNNLAAGNYNFAVYGEDNNGRRSTLFTFPVYITSGATTNISGIYIAPTIAVDKSEVRQGDNIAIFGQTVPNSNVTLSVHSNPEFFRYILADDDGVYLHSFDTSILDEGNHNTKSKSAMEGQISSYGQTISFMVGDDNVAVEDNEGLRGDVNNDRRVNLVDFSIVAYWYQRPNPPANVDLNNDNRVNLVDFSIMAYYWTG